MAQHVTLTCEYRRYANAEPCGKPTRRTVGDTPICSACLRTNGGLALAFRSGEAARSASGNLESRTEDGRAVLMSYRQPIGIRRAADGQVFTDAHSYSPTTSQHQREVSGWRDGLSFLALDGLLGPEWWKTARVVENAPSYCESAFCHAANARDLEAWRAMSYRVKTGERMRSAHGYECSDDCPPEHGGHTWHDQAYGQRMVTEDVFETRWYEGETPYPEFACLFPNLERGDSWTVEGRKADLVEQGLPASALTGHAITVAGEIGGHAYTLLTVADPLSANDQHVAVLCGLDHGRSNGRGTQLWAAILPANTSANDVDAALLALNPFTFLQDGTVHADVKRQGDLFFRPVAGECRCPCHVAERSIGSADVPRLPEASAQALRRAGILNADGTIRKRHGCHVSGNGSVPTAFSAQACKRAADDPPEGAIRVDGLELPDAGGRHVPTYAAINARRATFARGMVRHPQHSPIMLKTWHRVERSRATRATSAELRQWRAGGQFGYD